MYQHFLTNLSTTDLVLTPNRRLAAYLRQEYNILQQNPEQLCWQNIDIIPLQSWFERCWQEVSTTSTYNPMLLLNSQQEQLVWQQIIKKSSAGETLLCVTATAELAYQAWKIAQQWQINYKNTDWSQNENSKIWLSWAQEFQAICTSNRWLDSNSLPNWLMNAIKQQLLKLPKRIFLVGFDELCPQHQTLFNLLTNLDVDVSQHANTSPCGKVQTIPLPNLESELETMARWAHQNWQAGTHSIACIVPNLTEIRSKVLTTFTDVFAPEIEFPDQTEIFVPFNISAGIKLKDFSLIETALLILQLNSNVKQSLIRSLLQSSFLGFSEAEKNQRATLEIKLRATDGLDVSLQEVYVTAKNLGAHHLAKNLKTFLISTNHQKNNLSPYDWAKNFTEQLNLFGWPGNRTLNSTEYQLIESWSTLLSTFTKLALVTPSLNRQQAITELMKLADNEFQPQSPNKPIQILGLLEAAGLAFDKIWIMGLYEDAWPTAPKPNPFIPLKLQHQLQLPHSSSAREFAYCQALTKRFLTSGKEIILSYPEQLDDQRLKPSSLIKAYRTTHISELNLPSFISYSEKIFTQANLEKLVDEWALSVKQLTAVAGGSAIFKHQSACPFRAFAYFRLGIAPISETPSMGLSAGERGTLIHRVLEHTWNVIGDQKTLLQYSEKELETIIEQAIEKSLVSFIKKRPSFFQNRFIAIEKLRLIKQVREWLNLEKNRPPFSVYTTEKTATYSFMDFSITLRADRIDKVTDGNYLLIDYKTGNPAVSDWFGERPDDPQLPLYSVLSELPIEGVMFAQIQSNKKQFKGITQNEQLNIPGVYPLTKLKDNNGVITWQELVAQWRVHLMRLGEEFREGYAKVDPKDGLLTCQFCELQSLCRINEH